MGEPPHHFVDDTLHHLAGCGLGLFGHGGAQADQVGDEMHVGFERRQEFRLEQHRLQVQTLEGVTLDQLHDDVQVSEPAGLPIGGEYSGKAAFVGFLGKVAATYDVKIHRAKVMDAGELAVAHLDLTWTAHSTGASLDTQFCELYTVDGDKITSINVFPKDTKALYELTAAGVAPLP